MANSSVEVMREFRALVRDLLGLGEHDVRPGNAGLRAPTGDSDTPYVTVDAVEIELLDVATTRYTTNADDENMLDEHVAQCVQIKADVQFFRGDGLLQATRLSALLCSTSCVERMQGNDMALVDTSNVRRLPALFGTEFEERVTITVTFNAVVHDTVLTPTYGEVTIIVDDSAGGNSDLLIDLE